MKIHKVELNHVRQFRQLVLDLSEPLTVIGGPQGTGKSTLQTAIFGALFLPEKKLRDSFRSRFDPDSPPTAALTLSQRDGVAPIMLTRRLTDDTGEWRQGATVLKGKGASLTKVKESLPISAEAAAVLLWGLQEDMARVVEQFPADGHTLLTAATIRGAGPDPKQFAEELAEEYRHAKRGGQNPGPLTQAETRTKSLEGELQRAQAAQGELKQLERRFAQAQRLAQQAAEKREAIEAEGKLLKNLVSLLDPTVKALERLAELESTQEKWDALEKEHKESQQALNDLRGELGVIEAQYRVAKDKELGETITKLDAQVQAVQAAQRRRVEVESDLKSERRPERSDDELRQSLSQRLGQATDRMEASGVRYEISVESGSKKVRVSEDNAAAKEISVSPGKPHEGVVGSVVISSSELRVTASGKEDIAALKRSIERANRDLAGLFRKFGVKDEDGFSQLRAEKEELDNALQEVETKIERELRGETPALLQSELRAARRAQEENAVSAKDRQAYGPRHLGPAAEIEKKITRKATEIELAEKNLRALSGKLPTKEEKTELAGDLAAGRRQMDHAVAAFKDADEARREPSEQLLEKLRNQLEEKREEFRKLTSGADSPQNEVTRLATELKHAGPERPLVGIEEELEEAKSILRREQVSQEGRELLRQRIEQKILEMAADVPRELSNRVSEHLARLTRGAYGRVNLTEHLAVSSVREAGIVQEQWQPHELSCGERHQTALSVKIAVARALAETSGPVFIILDDSLVSFDPERRVAAEKCLLDLVGDGKLQVILLTCHTDWATDWKKRQPDEVNYIELASVADYYRPPPATLPK
jgi:DNA repair exonuclease SbcCD ATPase subunit